MFTRKWLSVVFVTLLALPALAIVPVSAQDDAPSFAEAGPYAVGYRRFVLDDAAKPRTGAIWYPAVQPDGVDAAIVPGGGLSLIADPGLASGNKPLLMLVAGADQGVVSEDNAFRIWDQTGSSMAAMAIFEDASHLFAGQCTPGMNANWPICAEPAC